MALDEPIRKELMVGPVKPQTQPPSRIGKRLLVHPFVWILFSGAIARVALWLAWANWSPLVNDDARDYERLAVRLVTTGTYSSDDGTLISLRPPGYSAMVAATYAIFGVKNNDAVRAVQAIISLATAGLVYRLATIIYSRRVALWTAAIVCFDPSLLGYANLLLSETLFTFFVVAFTWLVCEAIHRQQLLILVVAGVAMGVGALTRSILLLFAPIAGLLILLSWSTSLSRRVFAAALPLVVFAAVIAPWAIRNTRLQRTLTIIDVMGGRNAMMGNYEYTPRERSWATITDVPEEHQWYHVLQAERVANTPLTQGQLDKLALHHAIGFVKAHPWLTIQRDLVKFFNFWQLERLLLAAAQSGYFGELSAGTEVLLAAVICGTYAFVLISGVFGACCVPPQDKRYQWFLLASIGFPCAVHTLIFAHSRYHIPIMPLIAVYSAATIVRHREIWQLRGSLTFGVAVACSGLIALGWLRELLFVDFDLVKHLVG